VVVGLRRDWPFSGRDRALLDSLRSHLAAAHRDLYTRQEARALRKGLAASGHHFVLADAAGRMLGSSHGAMDRLRTYFPLHASASLLAAIVDPDRRPCQQRNGVQAEVVQRDGRWLVIRVLSGPASTPRLVLLEASPPVRLLHLGLTEREREVATLATSGRTNGEIAEALVVSAHTVKKHLEHVYAKLGVHTRTELASLARGTG
jgi:DNA-binding CsgD family transcriptional regulator